MRKLVLVVLMALCLSVTSAVAWAQDASYPPGPTGGEVSGGSGVRATAFTGGGLTVPLVLLVAFAALGAVAFVVARRRARAFTSEGR